MNFGTTIFCASCRQTCHLGQVFLMAKFQRPLPGCPAKLGKILESVDTRTFFNHSPFLVPKTSTVADPYRVRTGSGHAVVVLICALVGPVSHRRSPMAAGPYRNVASEVTVRDSSAKRRSA